MVLPRVTDRQHFPLVAVGFVPVNNAAAMLRIDLAIDGAMHLATVGNPSQPDAREDGIEFIVADAKTKVNQRNGIGSFVEVERQILVDENGHKRPDTGLRPGDTEQLGQLFCRRPLRVRGHHQVIKLNRHVVLPGWKWDSH